MKQFILKKNSLVASTILLLITTPSLAQCWVDNDLSADAAASGRNHAGNAVTNSPLAGDWDSASNQYHVNYFTLDTKTNKWHVAELVNKGSGWESSDLTANAINKTVAAPGSALDRYWAPEGDQHVNFLDEIGHVHELYISPSGGPWRDNDLKNAATNGTTARPGSALAGYSQGGDQHVIFLDWNNDVHEIYKTGGKNWYDTDLTRGASGGTPAAPGSALAADWDESSHQQHINFLDESGHVHELFHFSGSDQWKDNDLTSETVGASSAAPGSPLARYHQGDNQHVNFIDLSGDVHDFECCSTGAWHDTNMTTHAANGKPSVQTGNGLISRLAGDWNGAARQQHVNFFVAVTKNNTTEWHVHELVAPPAQRGFLWADDDLTALKSHSPIPAAPGSGLDRYWGNGNDQSVNYIDTSGHVHQLYISDRSGGC